MKVLKIVRWVFTIVGIGLLLGSLFVYQNTRSFLAQAVEANGTVIGLEHSRSSSTSSSGSSSTYRPVVEFTTAAGKRIEFTSSVGSNPPSYREGEPVTVLYLAAEPYRAKIKSFFSLWFGLIILLGLGLPFTGVGVGMGLVQSRSRKKAEWLRRHGRRMRTAFTSVELNNSLRVNGRSPYRIISQSADPASNTVRVFQSENIWFDPTEYIKGETIEVLVDPRNPGKYLMDTSFLPKLAED
jgi:hypothetical protein